MKLSIPSRSCRNLSSLVVAVAMAAWGLRAADVSAPVAATTPETGAVAKIAFDSTVYDFEKVTGGQAVRHDFFFTNAGTAVLKITSVNASCGCTTAGEWTREVAPGAVGKIPLQFNSGNFSGAVTKTATVGCNDPATPTVMLQIKGTVWRPIEMTPQMAMLNVNAEMVSNATAVVRITNHAPEPLAVFEPASSNPQFAAEVRTNSPGQLFEVVVHSVPPLNVVNPHGVITLKTSSTNTPVLTFNAMCILQPSVLINPPRVVIPEAQLTGEWTTKVNFRNSLNRPLQLSDVAVNLPGARAELRELESGRTYEVTLVVPATARDAMNELALTLKSNFADYPSIRVPIVVVNANNAVTAQGIPLTARANRFLNRPQARAQVIPDPLDYEPAADHHPADGHEHEAAPKPPTPVAPK